jgi:hypothetical protein
MPGEKADNGGANAKLIGGESERQAVMKNPWNTDPLSFAGMRGISPSPAIGGGGTPRHPILASAFLGAAGGATGVIAGGVLLVVLGMVFGEAFFGTVDFGEGLGYLVGIYCVVMFPVGGGILGAIPAAILGWLRASRDEPVNAPLLAVTGFLAVLVITGGGIAALFLFVPR